jgi:predicted dehydrogenase
LPTSKATLHVASRKSLRQTSFIAKWLLRPSRNYIKNPMLKLARSMAAAGELGEITGFRGIHAYMADIAGGERRGPDFREAWEIQKIIDMAVQSSRLRRWQAIE